MSDDLCFSTASDLVEAYSTGGLSPVEVTQALLKRIAAVNPKLNAYCLVDEDSALKDARASEARWTAGKPPGPVDGVPASIKDRSEERRVGKEGVSTCRSRRLPSL